MKGSVKKKDNNVVKKKIFFNKACEKKEYKITINTGF